MAYGRRRGFANPNPHKRGEFPNPDRRNMFSNSIETKEDIQILISFLILFLLLMGVLIVKLTLFWIDEIDKLLDIEYIPIEEHVKFVTYKLKGRAAWWNQFQIICIYQGKPL